MLLKLYLDADKFPLQLPNATSQLCMWLVHDGLPLSHEKQAIALLKAAKLSPTLLGELDLAKLWFLEQQPSGGGEAYLDNHTQKTVAELGLKAGVALRITNVAPSTTSSTRRLPSQQGSAHVDPRMAKYRTSKEEDDMSEPDTDGATQMHLPGGAGGADEVYDGGLEKGWFPFTHGVGPEGEATVEFPNPDVEPKESDPRPNTQPLCNNCSDIVIASDSARAPVIRHTKPVVLDTSIAEGLVEKVGGSRVPRWQPRWLMIGEKSLNWYEGEPKTGREKLKGTRAMWEGDKFLLQEVITEPDTTKHPKVKDKPNMYHFGCSFMSSSGSPVTLIFRVSTESEKARYVNFMIAIVERVANKGRASRDPVHWKKTANSFLLCLADVGELSVENDEEEEALLREISLLEEEQQALHIQKPLIQAEMFQLSQQIQFKQQNILCMNDRRQELNKIDEDAQLRVQSALRDLAQYQSEISEEMRLTKMLEDRAIARKAEVDGIFQTRIKELEVLEQYQHQLFSQVRKGEEHHRSDGNMLLSDKVRHYSFGIGTDTAHTPTRAAPFYGSPPAGRKAVPTATILASSPLTTPTRSSKLNTTQQQPQPSTPKLVLWGSPAAKNPGKRSPGGVKNPDIGYAANGSPYFIKRSSTSMETPTSNR